MRISEKLTTLIKLELLEEEAQNQIWRNVNLKEVLSMSIMPDCHTGYDIPIGSVIITNPNIICPSYVGFDLFCGICHINTKVNVNDLFPKEKLKQKALDKIIETIPSGVGKNHTKIKYEYPDFKSLSGDSELTKTVNNLNKLQLGTLGSGNHFIEIGINKNNEVGITIHSGSRGCGYKVAEYYMNKKFEKFLKLDTEIGQAYVHDFIFFENWAYKNRSLMLYEVLKILGFSKNEIVSLLKNIINEHHNHAIVTNEGVIHRKGATPADLNQYGVIPGNMRDGVFITKGLGNKEYLSSASHGAGRKLSRSKAKKKFTFEDFEKQMNSNIIANICKDTIDECPSCYKNIDDVIKMQEGIVVEIVDFFKPIINFKGV